MLRRDVRSGNRFLLFTTCASATEYRAHSTASQDRARNDRIAKDFAPRPETLSTGQQNRATFIAPAHEREEAIGTLPDDRDVTNLVDDQPLRLREDSEPLVQAIFIQRAFSISRSCTIWQRAANENTDELLRQYFPKSTDLSGYTQSQLNRVAAELNGRPRQTLQWSTPSEAFARIVAMTD